MQTIFIIWLILGLFASVCLIAALMLSSRNSQREGDSESYDDWEAAEQTKEIYRPHAEQQ
jgi:hypothetical protein